jgi:hypothetical protein
VFLGISLYLLLSWRVDRTVRPSCPVCGRDVLQEILRDALMEEGDERFKYGLVRCSCGYNGSRDPIDGLWVFVERYGSDPLKGSPLEVQARKAGFLLHGGKD